MIDIIWTIILVWLVYKIVDIFRLSTAKKSSREPGPQSRNNHQSTQHSDKDIRNAIKKHINKEGEYIDFEEIK